MTICLLTCEKLGLCTEEKALNYMTATDMQLSCKKYNAEKRLLKKTFEKKFTHMVK